MATRQLRVVALLVALPALLGIVGACGTLIGIEDLGVDTSSTTPDGGKRTETGAPMEEAGSDAEANATYEGVHEPRTIEIEIGAGLCEGAHVLLDPQERWQHIFLLQV